MSEYKPEIIHVKSTDAKAASVRTSPATQSGSDIIALLERVVTNPEVDVSKVQMLLDMQRQLRKDDAEREFNSSMSLAQAEMQPVARGAKADRYQFAEFDAIDMAIRPIYTKHGFALTFGSKDSPKGICITCTVLHKGGHSRDYEMSGALDTAGAKGTANKTEIQGSGSSASYLQKYLTRLIFNIVTKKDTDGAAPEDQEFITTEQAAALDLRLRAISDQALPGFLKWAKIEALTNIYAKSLKAAEAAIKDMEAKKAAAAAPKKGAA